MRITIDNLLCVSSATGNLVTITLFTKQGSTAKHKYGALLVLGNKKLCQKLA